METATDAQRRAVELIEPEATAEARTTDGYIDLLGDDDVESTGTAQDLMTTRLVPRIYERYWRPAWARALKGPTGPSMSEELRIARLLMGLRRGDTVLDVACGPGNFSRAFARIVGDAGLVAGIDASRTMLARGAAETDRSGVGNLALVRGDAIHLPFRSGSFDAVCCFAALHLFAEPFTALDQMRRVLGHEGRIAIMTSARRGITPAPLKPVLERASGMRVFETDEIVAALEARGFTGIHRRLAGLTQFVGGRVA